MDVSTPLRMKIKYQRDDSLYECLIDCKYNQYLLWGVVAIITSSNATFKVERLQESCQDAENCDARVMVSLHLKMLNGCK